MPTDEALMEVTLASHLIPFTEELSEDNPGFPLVYITDHSRYLWFQDATELHMRAKFKGITLDAYHKLTRGVTHPNLSGEINKRRMREATGNTHKIMLKNLPRLEKVKLCLPFKKRET